MHPLMFHKDIVPSCSTTIYTEPAAPILDGLNKFVCSELAALIGIDYLRNTVPIESLLQNIDRMACRRGDGQLCSHYYFPACPINNHRQITRIELPFFLAIPAPCRSTGIKKRVGCLEWQSTLLVRPYFLAFFSSLAAGVSVSFFGAD